MALAKLTLADEMATLALAQALASLVKPGMLVLLEGELAAGKTTFVRGLLHALGHVGKVKSPTFTVVESYDLPQLTVHHFDLYRVNDPDELHYLGFDDFLAAAALCLIEWPSRAAGLLPPASLRLSLEIVDEERRQACLETLDTELQKGLEKALAISFISV